MVEHMVAPTIERPTYSEVVAESRRPLTSLAWRLLGDKTLAEDVTQDALVALLGAWDHVENPRGFARSAVFNRCRDVQRREINARQKTPLLRASERADILHPVTSPYLADVISTLPPLWREFVVLRFYGGHSLDEIADITGRSVGTVKSGLHRALRQLRTELDDDTIPHAA